ncbi:hypothetical protein GXM_02784 [Nostoc sphaeroides CCNUC1]|uniref:Uncharacterized protein n=1 Tax=Nostoc sphaeroides CCNUC1 TaxID=2653204 RepID=A0A5P8VY44_9NOSO|nr:hypothetical protein GXM_02784 [Nostoc sphaeroides CCNUC1]
MGHGALGIGYCYSSSPTPPFPKMFFNLHLDSPPVTMS